MSWRFETVVVVEPEPHQKGLYRLDVHRRRIPPDPRADFCYVLRTNNFNFNNNNNNNKTGTDRGDLVRLHQPRWSEGCSKKRIQRATYQPSTGPCSALKGRRHNSAKAAVAFYSATADADTGNIVQPTTTSTTAVGLVTGPVIKPSSMA